MGVYTVRTPSREQFLSDIANSSTFFLLLTDCESPTIRISKTLNVTLLISSLVSWKDFIWAYRRSATLSLGYSYPGFVTA